LVLAVLSHGSTGSLFGDDGPLAWQLRPAMQSSLGGAYLDELFANAPTLVPHVRLPSTCGTISQTVALSRAQVLDLLRQHAPEMVVSNWVGPMQIKITRRRRALDESELKTLLTETLQRDLVKDKGDLELRLTRPWTPVAIPDDPLKLKILELPVAGVTPNFIVRFELSDDRDTIGTWQVPLQAHVWREVMVAGSLLRRGQPVKDADLRKERRDVLALREIITSIDTESGALEIGENLPAGTPLGARSIRLRPVVRRGKIADAIVQDGAMTISVKVEVLEDGAPGQIVRVRNVQSKREFRGKVENEEMVLVTL
jgi:flagella basal body P-ring formation protein FlgA